MTSFMKRGVIVGAFAGLVGASASAGILHDQEGDCYFAFYEDQQTGFTNSPNNEVGDLVFVDSFYNPTSETFRWEIGYDQNVDGELPDSFVLAVNDGPKPKTITGYIAAIYFDGTGGGAPVVSAYAYNGRDSATSHDHGDYVDPTSAPDRIVSTLDGSSPAFVNEASVSNSDPRADRVFVLELDATPINAHTPTYPNAGPGWLGIAYSTSIGVWMHPFKEPDTAYDGDGYLTQFDFDRLSYGWYDFSDGEAEKRIVPEPAVALLLAAPLAALRRRRG